MVETWHQDRQAINHVENIVLQLGWMWREQPILDYGIDGQIEICNDDRKPTGQLFAVQSKGGESFFYRRQRDVSLTIRLQQKHLRYWNNYPLPVLVIGRLPIENKAYWLYIQDYMDRYPDVLKAETKNVSIKVPTKNVFDVNAKPLLHVIPDRHLELIASRISPNVNILDELLRMAEQADLDLKAFRELVIEWHERAPDPIKTRVAKSGILERLEQTLNRLQQDAPLLPAIHLPMAKQVLQCLAQGLRGAGVKQIMDIRPRRLGDQGTLLLRWKLGTQSPRLMLADYVGEVHSNRLSIILNPESSLTLRAYQKDGSVVEITSATYQPHEWLDAVAVWERPQVSLWINGQQFGPSPLPAGFNSLGPLLLFGLDIENKLSADAVRWAPPGEEVGLNLQKDGIWHGSCWQLGSLWERAFHAQEIVRLCADPFAMLRPRLCNNGNCPDCGSPVVIDRHENNREPDERLKRLDGSRPTGEDFLPRPPAVWCVCTKCGRPCLSREGFPAIGR